MIVDEPHLAKVEALAANATGGPWYANWTGARHSIDTRGGSIGEVYDAPNGTNDAAFVVHARDLLVDLCADVRRLAGIIETQTAALVDAAEIAESAPGCAMPDCRACARNKTIRERINAALKLATATPSNDESVF